ncbi:MerR family DNA-binding protein [Azohydromonas aeria]|uniref:MerR family DNA-binding protein n=1 Tax=Azohydromonas aeria TaxID=2590212 RepID=UPI0012F8B4EC|nr:MerR family DNA-binding protein [Azohydromonas aeria]
MYIGALSQATQASPKAIRLYESLGLLSGVRRQGQYRIYSESHVRQVTLIRRAQALGFTLAELKPVLTGQGGAPDWNRVAECLKQKQEAVDREIHRLQHLRARIGAVLIELAECTAEPAAAIPQPCDAVPA